MAFNDRFMVIQLQIYGHLTTNLWSIKLQIYGIKLLYFYSSLIML